MINNITAKVFTADQFVGFIEQRREVYTESTLLEQFFPVKLMVGLDYSYIKTSNSAVELTSPSAFDAEPIAQNREGFDASMGELPLFRKKMILGEKEKQLLRTYLALGDEEGVDRVLIQIYDDQATLLTGARMTMEFLRARALMDGKINIMSKGGAVSIDYKVPDANKYTLSGDDAWDNEDALVLDQIEEWIEDVEDETGYKPSKMIMNKTTFKLLRNNKQIQANLLPLAVLGLTGADLLAISDTQILETIKSYTGLSEIIVYNRKVKLDGTIYDLIEDNKIAIFPEGVLGNTMIGTSPAELNASEANAAGAGIAVTSDGIAVNTYTTTSSPYVATTEVEFIGLPSLVQSDSIVLATVK